MLSNPLKRKNFSIILPMSERVKCSTTRVSFTSNRIWASVFEIGYLYVLTSLTIVLATYLLVCCYRWNHQNNTSFVKCSALWWNDTRQHHTGEFCCEGKWKKNPDSMVMHYIMRISSMNACIFAFVGLTMVMMMTTTTTTTTTATTLSSEQSRQGHVY